MFNNKYCIILFLMFSFACEHFTKPFNKEVVIDSEGQLLSKAIKEEWGFNSIFTNSSKLSDDMMYIIGEPNMRDLKKRDSLMLIRITRDQVFGTSYIYRINHHKEGSLFSESLKSSRSSFNPNEAIRQGMVGFEFKWRAADSLRWYTIANMLRSTKKSQKPQESLDGGETFVEWYENEKHYFFYIESSDKTVDLFLDTLSFEGEF